MKSFVIGGAGFIGSHLVDQLVEQGPVTVFDDLSAGRRENLATPLGSGKVRLIQDTALDLGSLRDSMAGHDIVFHLAANTDIQFGGGGNFCDLEQGTLVTYNVLEAVRFTGVPKLVFSSSGTVYGNTPEPCGEEDLGHLPISLYGASKLACEALISAFVELYGLQGVILRFGNVVGARLTHGVMHDFLVRLKAKPDCLEVYGDGKQTKPYLHVSDCVEGILHAVRSTEGLKTPAIFNLAPKGGTTVDQIAKLCIAASSNPSATVVYTGGTQGWKGDIPVSRLKPDKLAAWGFKVHLTSDQASELAVLEMAREALM